MPEHAAVDTSIFNELIPQALQQTLYTKKKKKKTKKTNKKKPNKLQMYKRPKASLVPLSHSQVYIIRGSWEIHVQQLEWIPFPAKSVQ